MLRKQYTLLSCTFRLLLSLLSFGCGDSSSSGGALTGIDIAPISPSIAVGGTQQFTATGHFFNGPHTFRSADGRKALAIEVRGGKVANIEITEMTLTRR